MTKTIWVIGDLHLAIGVPGKEMDVFGAKWIGYTEKIKQHWEEVVQPDDLVLIPGDITWAMKIEEAATDLQWIDALPGTKVMIRGNHDYWWSSMKKMREHLPESIHVIQNNSFDWNSVSIGGSRLWDTEEYHFNSFIEYQPNKREKASKPSREWSEEEKAERLAEQEKIFDRELGRLEISLKSMKQDVDYRIYMTHYPPVGANLAPSRTSALLEKYHIDCCLFGHLHNVRDGSLPFGKARGVEYILTSADYIDFKPVKVFSLS